MADDLNRWLRLVRPPTEGDADWTSSTAADELLSAVHHRITRRTRIAVGRSRIAIPVGVLSAAAVAVLLVTSLSPSPPPAHPGAVGRGPAPQLPTLRPAAMTLEPFGTCADLLAGLRKQTAAHVTTYGLPGISYGYGPRQDLGLGYRETAGALPTASLNNAADTSTTNVQEIGVDEPDIVKTDGDRVITITDGSLHVLDASTHAVTGALDLTVYNGWQSATLLLSGDHAVIILNTMPSVGYDYGLRSPYLGSQSASRSTVIFVDLHGAPTITGSLRITGSYVDARMVGSTIRLVASSVPAITLINPSQADAKRIPAFRKTVMRAPLSAWLPSYTVTSGATTATRTVPCDQVSHPRAYTGASMLTIYTLDMSKLGNDPQPISVAADGDTVYATSTSLYVTSNPQWSCCAPPTASTPTEIHRFDIAGSGRPLYLGSGAVAGRLLSQYSLSEYGGTLRIVTSSGAAAQSNGVYLLDADTLKEVGHIGGIGNGQQLYAVRFVGAFAYVVTFRQTDPLYVLDLSNPRAPRVLGSLELNGNSSYLHDAGDGRIIGFGEAGDSQGRITGLQVSLFDVGNGAAPKLTSRVVVPNAVGSALDPHAFLYWASTGLVAVPIQSWSSAQSGRVLVVQLTGTTLRKLGVLSNPLGSATDDHLGIQRSLIVDGALWTVSGSGVQVSDENTLARVAWVPFG